MGNWMKDAVKPSSHGVFAKKAAKAGKSTAEFASEKSDAPGKLGKEAQLAQTFAKFRPKAKGGAVDEEKTESKKERDREKKVGEEKYAVGGMVRDASAGRTRALDAQKMSGGGSCYATGGTVVRGAGAAQRGTKFTDA